MSYVLRVLLIEKKNPLKQGLKPLGIHRSMTSTTIEKKNPLKQGLKLSILKLLQCLTKIEKKNPLKQGLKHANSPPDKEAAIILKRRIH